jgi:hypothetical protein
VPANGTTDARSAGCALRGHRAHPSDNPANRTEFLRLRTRQAARPHTPGTRTINENQIPPSSPNPALVSARSRRVLHVHTQQYPDPLADPRARCRRRARQARNGRGRCARPHPSPSASRICLFFFSPSILRAYQSEARPPRLMAGQARAVRCGDVTRRAAVARASGSCGGAGGRHRRKQPRWEVVVGAPLG